MHLEILRTNTFKKAVKKLHTNQRKGVEEAIQYIIKHPTSGQAKKGDLAGIRVHKFKIDTQLMPLSDQCSASQLILVALGSHENFYRDPKNN